MPPSALGMLSACVAGSLPMTACNAAINAKELPRKVGHTPAGAKMKDDGAKPRRKQRHANVQPGQQRNQNGRTGHRESVLKAQEHHFSGAYSGIFLGTRKNYLVDF